MVDSNGVGVAEKTTSLHEEHTPPAPSWPRIFIRRGRRRPPERVVELFKGWDEDGLGTIEKRDFRMAIPALGARARATCFPPSPHSTFDSTPSTTLRRRSRSPTAAQRG